MPDPGTALTRHARQRARQRGVSFSAIELVLSHGDIEIPARAGCRFLRLSHRAATELLDDGVPVAQVDRALRVNVLLAATGGVVTVIKSTPARCRPPRRMEYN